MADENPSSSSVSDTAHDPAIARLYRAHVQPQDRRGIERTAFVEASNHNAAVRKITETLRSKKLAELANIDRTYPSMLERGLRQPTLGRVIAIANALDIQPVVRVVSTVARLRAQGAASALARHATSTSPTAQHHAGAPGGIATQNKNR